MSRNNNMDNIVVVAVDAGAKDGGLGWSEYPPLVLESLHPTTPY